MSGRVKCLPNFQAIPWKVDIQGSVDKDQRDHNPRAKKNIQQSATSNKIKEICIHTWVVQMSSKPPPHPISWPYHRRWMVMISTAYAVFTLQLAMTVISTCSFMLKGPGLKKRDLGITFSIILPRGKLINWITSGVTTIAFCRNQKNWLMNAKAQQKMIARNHMRKVYTGNVGSSVLSKTCHIEHPLTCLWKRINRLTLAQQVVLLRWENPLHLRCVHG